MSGRRHKAVLDSIEQTSLKRQALKEGRLVEQYAIAVKLVV